MLNNNDCPTVWFRYVDTFTLFATRTQLLTFFIIWIVTITTCNSPLNLNRTVKYLSWKSLSSANRTTPSQHRFTAKKSSLAFTLNATPLHLVSTRLISSAHSLIIVSTSVHQPLYYSLLLMMCGIFCPVMVTSRVSLLRTWIKFWTDTVTKQWYHHYSP